MTLQAIAIMRVAMMTERLAMMTVIVAMMRVKLENQQIRTSSGLFVLEREKSGGHLGLEGRNEIK